MCFLGPELWGRCYQGPPRHSGGSGLFSIMRGPPSMLAVRPDHMGGQSPATLRPGLV